MRLDPLPGLGVQGQRFERANPQGGLTSEMVIIGAERPTFNYSGLFDQDPIFEDPALQVGVPDGAVLTSASRSIGVLPDGGTLIAGRADYRVDQSPVEDVQTAIAELLADTTLSVTSTETVGGGSFALVDQDGSVSGLTGTEIEITVEQPADSSTTWISMIYRLTV